MVTNFTPEDLPLLEGISPGQGVESLGIYGHAKHSGRYRAAIESVLIFRVMTQLNMLMEKDGLLGAYCRFYVLLQIIIVWEIACCMILCFDWQMYSSE